MGRLFLTSLIAFGIPIVASAQHGPGGIAPAASHATMAGGHTSFTGSRSSIRVSVGTPAMQGSAASASHPQGAARRIRQVNHHSNGVPLTQFGTTDFEDVPGLGFDFPHLAAISGTRRHHRGLFGTFPFGVNGFLLSSPPVIVEEVPVETQAASAEEENVAENEPEVNQVRRPVSARRSVSPRAYDAQDSGSGVASATGEEPAEYVFVRCDGGLVFAVAYSWENGTLRYVTRDGMRRTIARDAIDLTATQQFNEQRGLSFPSPA